MDLTVEFGIYFSRVSDFISVWILFSSDIGAVAAEAAEFKELGERWKHSHVDDDDQPMMTIVGMMSLTIIVYYDAVASQASN